MKSSLIVWLALFALAAARPKTKSSAAESEGEAKLREKRKYEIPLLQQLEESGVGVKRAEETKESPSEVVESPPEGGKGEKGGAEEAASGGGPRVKKQSPNNVGGCGKTVCGPIVSARGPVVGDMKAMLQSGKPMLSLGEVRPPNDITEFSPKLEALAPLRARTVDSMGVPLGLGTLGYGAPASYPTVDLGHSFFKPPSIPSVAVLAPPQQPSHPLIHPWLAPHLLPHILPHLMPSLMPALGSYFPHRLEPSRFPEVIPTEVKQPVPVFPQPFYGVNGDNALLCQPVRNRGLDASFDPYYKPDAAADKSINVTEESKKSQNGFDGDERKIHDHIKKVNEIKDEITQLNRAAQRIVDQQERLAAMQHRQTWPTPRQSQGFDQTINPYMGTDFYAHPALPWGYSRSSLMSYPRSEDDIDFFINLLRMGKRMGALSDAVHPTSVLATIGELLKGVQNGDKVQKEPSVSGAQTEETAAAKPEKKSIK